jgi:hypothetical protein
LWLLFVIGSGKLSEVGGLKAIEGLDDELDGAVLSSLCIFWYSCGKVLDVVAQSLDRLERDGII